MPKRQADGFDANRLLKIIAVMEKRLKIGLADRDIYVAIVGGLRIKEPAIDLAIASAIYSSLKNIPMDRNTVYIGEIGLTGEVRQIPHVVERISEAKRLGFQKIFCAKPIPKEINKDGINAVESLYQIFND
jgi:DNA repair protein RadA/Sms